MQVKGSGFTDGHLQPAIADFLEHGGIEYLLELRHVAGVDGHTRGQPLECGPTILVGIEGPFDVLHSCGLDLAYTQGRGHCYSGECFLEHIHLS
jgi:hypothetical protein